MVFQPSMEQDATDGFYALVESLLDDVFNFASLVPRVAKHKDLSDYLSDVEEVREKDGQGGMEGEKRRGRDMEGG